ncbi:MAG: DUF4097 family beta strand repeat-containing protein [Myxococcota bacterium]
MSSLLLLLFAPADAAERVLSGRFDETLAAPAPARMNLDVVCGSIATRASPRVTVRITGSVQPDGQLHVERIGDRLHVAVRQIRMHRQSQLCTDLVIELPEVTDLTVETVSADVDHQGTKGRLVAETVSGNVTVGNGVRDVEVETVSGDVRVGSTRSSLDVTTVSGDVDALGIAGELKVETVSGEVSVTGTLARSEVTTVSGSVQLLAGLSTPGELEIHGHSGDVGVIVQSDVDATFELETYSGALRVDDVTIPKHSRGPGQSHRFVRGRGAGIVKITTFSGDAVVVAR